MKVHPMIAGAVISAILALQGWMLREISTIKENVSWLRAKVENISPGRVTVTDTGRSPATVATIVQP